MNVYFEKHFEQDLVSFLFQFRTTSENNLICFERLKKLKKMFLNKRICKSHYTFLFKFALTLKYICIKEKNIFYFFFSLKRIYKIYHLKIYFSHRFSILKIPSLKSWNFLLTHSIFIEFISNLWVNLLFVFFILLLLI